VQAVGDSSPSGRDEVSRGAAETRRDVPRRSLCPSANNYPNVGRYPAGGCKSGRSGNDPFHRRTEMARRPFDTGLRLRSAPTQDERGGDIRNRPVADLPRGCAPACNRTGTEKIRAGGRSTATTKNRDMSARLGVHLRCLQPDRQSLGQSRTGSRLRTNPRRQASGVLSSRLLSPYQSARRKRKTALRDRHRKSHRTPAIALSRQRELQHQPNGSAYRKRRQLLAGSKSHYAHGARRE